MIPFCGRVLRPAAGLLSGHLATSFLNLYLPRVTTVYLPLFLFHLTLFPLWLLLPCFHPLSYCFFIFLLPLHLDPNLNLFSWVCWPEIWALGPRHSETRSLEKADEGPRHWRLGYFGDHIPRGWFPQGECVGDLFCACCWEQAVLKPWQECNPCMTMPPALQAPFVPWIPLLGLTFEWEWWVTQLPAFFFFLIHLTHTLTSIFCSDVQVRDKWEHKDHIVLELYHCWLPEKPIQKTRGC